MKQARLKQEVSRLQARNEWLPPGVSAVELRRQLAKGAMQHMDECVETCKTVLKGSMKVKNLTIEDQQLLSGAMVTLFATLSRPLRGNVCVCLQVCVCPPPCSAGEKLRSICKKRLYVKTLLDEKREKRKKRLDPQPRSEKIGARHAYIYICYIYIHTNVDLPLAPQEKNCGVYAKSVYT